MKHKQFSCFIIFFISILFQLSAVTAQSDSLLNLKNSFLNENGLDVLLFNGHYFYPENNIVEGTPFWNNDSLISGDIYIDGRVFSNQNFIYDIFHQEFILVFDDRNKAQKYIVLASDRIDSVKTGNTCFIKNNFTEINNAFLQTAYTGKISCFLSWKVEKSFNSFGDKVGFRYTHKGYTIYVSLNNQLLKLSRKKDFLELLPESDRNEISTFMRRKRIRWKRISLSQLKLLFSECEKLFY